MSYDGSSVQKIGTAPSPSAPLTDESDTPERESPGTFALRVELLLSKMKDAYYHGTEDYFKTENTDRKKLLLPFIKPKSCYKPLRRMHTQQGNYIRNCTPSEHAFLWKENAAGNYLNFQGRKMRP